jgi:hypothetical protein
MTTENNGVTRIGELSGYKLDDIQHEIKMKYKKRIPKKELLGLAIDQLRDCPHCEKKLKAWILAYKRK